MTQEVVTEVDAQFGHVARIVADREILADIRGERDVEIAQALKVNPILVYTTWLGDGEQQEIELLERVRQPW